MLSSLTLIQSLFFPESNTLVRVCLSCVFPLGRNAFFPLTLFKSTHYCSPPSKTEVAMVGLWMVLTEILV